MCPVYLSAARLSRSVFLDAALLYHFFSQEGDGLLRTFIDTAVAHGAAAAGDCLACIHGDVSHGAQLLAFAAAYALICIDPEL